MITCPGAAGATAARAAAVNSAVKCSTTSSAEAFRSPLIHSSSTSTTPGLCLLEGFYTPFGRATLQSLYPTHADYVARFTATAQADLAAGFLTRYDYNQAVKAAQAAPIP